MLSHVSPAVETWGENVSKLLRIHEILHIPVKYIINLLKFTKST